MVAVNLAPAAVDLSGVRAGDRNAMRVTLTTGSTDTPEPGAPLDLTGLDITAQARLTKTAPSSLDAVVEDIDAPGGSFTLRWPGADVRTLLGALDAWNGVWDCQLADPAAPDEAETVMAGSFRAELDVTREGAMA